jgi:hypothetical protein
MNRGAFEVSKHDIYTEPDKRPDHQTAEDVEPDPDLDGEEMRRQERALGRAGFQQKGDISGSELAATGGLLEPEQAETGMPLPLYVYRPLKNADELIAWAKGQGFKTTLPAGDMHVTLCYSKTAMDWGRVKPEDWDFTVPAGKRTVERLGKAIVLRFDSPHFATRHNQLRDARASHDYDAFRAHVTISYGRFIKKKIKPYEGPLVFGPEVLQRVKEDWEKGLVEKADIDLVSELNKVVTKGGQVAIDTSAALTTSRLVTLGFLSEAQDAGHQEYQVDEVLDDRTCPVCMLMNGKRINVADQFNRTIQALSAGDPQDLKTIAPWPDGVEDVAGLDEDELQGNGYGAPPYHPGCRGMLSLVDAENTAANSAFLPEVADNGEEDNDNVDQEADDGVAGARSNESDWSPDDVERLGWERYDVTDPVVFADVDDAFAAGEYGTAQSLIDDWKAEHDVEKADRDPELVAIARIKDLRHPPKSNPRVERDRRRLRAGEKLHPVHLQPTSDGHYVVVNGDHRLEACRLEGKTHLLAYTHGSPDAEHAALLDKEEEFEGPNQAKKKRRNHTPGGREQDYDDIHSDSSSVAFDSGVMNDMDAPIDRV